MNSNDLRPASRKEIVVLLAIWMLGATGFLINRIAHYWPKVAVTYKSDTELELPAASVPQAVGSYELLILSVAEKQKSDPCTLSVTA
jgi:hypothetical protein